MPETSYSFKYVFNDTCGPINLINLEDRSKDLTVPWRHTYKFDCAIPVCNSPEEFKKGHLLRVEINTRAVVYSIYFQIHYLLATTNYYDQNANNIAGFDRDHKTYRLNIDRNFLLSVSMVEK